MSANAKLVLSAKDKTKGAFATARANLNGFVSGASAAKAAVVSLVGATGMGLLVKRTFETADALAKTSDKLGLTTGQLAGLRHAAELSGVANNQLDTSLQRVTRRIAEAARGSGEAKDALRELGINATELAKLPLPDQLGIIADRMNGVQRQSDRVRLSMKLFDSEGVALVNTLSMGSKGLKAAAKEAEDLGLAISRVDAAQIEAANDAMTRVKALSQGTANIIAVKFAPVVEFLATKFVEVSKQAGGFQNIAERAAKITVKGIGFAVDAVQALRFAWAAAKTGVAGFFALFVEGAAKFDQMLANMANQLKRLVTGPLVSGLKLFGHFSDTASEAAAAIENFNFVPIEGLQVAAETANKVFRDMKEEMDRIAMQGLQSDKIIADFDLFVEKSRKAAEEVARLRASAFQPESLDAGAATSGTDDDERAKHQKRLEAFRASLSSETELLIANSEEKLALLSEFGARGLIQDEERAALREEIMKRHFNRMKALAQNDFQAQAALWESGWKGKIAVAQIASEKIFSMGAQYSKKMFKLNKIAGIANAVVSTAQGIAEALKLGWPMGLIAGAQVAAAGYAQIRAIRATQFGGGGSVSKPTAGGGGGTVTPPQPSTPTTTSESAAATSQQPQRPTSNFTFVGDTFSRDFIERFAEKLNEVVADGGAPNIKVVPA